MKQKLFFYLLLTLICIGFILCILRIFAVNGQQRLLFVRGTVRSGIIMQTAVNEFSAQFNRYPTYVEFTNVIGFIENSSESVTPYKTNRISPTFDNLGGWYYNDKTGEVKINYNGNYQISFGMHINLAKINFQSPTKVEAFRFGSSELLDYSQINTVIGATGPQIREIIENWATTNMIATGLARPTGPKK